MVQDRAKRVGFARFETTLLQNRGLAFQQLTDQLPGVQKGSLLKRSARLNLKPRVRPFPDRRHLAPAGSAAL